jgi:hypothetical protein
MFRPEKACVGREWRGVYGFQNVMFIPINECGFGASIVAPQQKYQTLSFFRKLPDYGIGKLFPTSILV